HHRKGPPYMRLTTVVMAFALLFALMAPSAYAEKPLDWKLTFAEGNHLLKGHLNASASQIKGKTTIHIHGQNPIVLEQNTPNVKATLDGLEEGKTYQGTITFEGEVAGQKVSVSECFTLYVATPGKSLNEKHILKYGECEKDNDGNSGDKPGNQPGDNPDDQPGDTPDQQPGDQPNDGQQSPEDKIDNPKGGKMPKTATDQPTQLLIGSLLLLAGAAFWKFRGVSQN
nr:hypothetical protein [Bacillota bacterium]